MGPKNFTFKDIKNYPLQAQYYKIYLKFTRRFLSENKNCITTFYLYGIFYGKKDRNRPYLHTVYS